MRTLFTLILSVICLGASALTSDPIDYRGSRKPYQAPAVEPHYPDSLIPVMINHVGRHGARYATSPSKIKNITQWLEKAEKAGTITQKGKSLLSLSRRVLADSEGRWGELDSIGIAEQEGIAARMYTEFPQLFKTNVTAISSYVPRCVMSMYAFCHRITQLNDKISIITSSGPQNNIFMRPFGVSQAYIDYSHERPYQKSVNLYKRSVLPTQAARELMGADYKLSDKYACEIIEDAYYLVSSCSAIGLNVDPTQYFSIDDYRRMWLAANLQQFYVRTANRFSSVPADIASDLVMNLVTTTQSFIDGTDTTPVHLRFGHAETILPLVSLLKIEGCYAPADCPDSDIANYWQNSNIIPMASNLQMILFKSTTGNYYLSIRLNEKPVALIPGTEAGYIPWNTARAYMIQCVPAN